MNTQDSAQTTPDAAEHPLPEGLTAVTSPAPAIDVETPACTGTVLRQGAQVLRWAPSGTGPVLWVSRLAKFEAHQAVRGGVPVCFPWFGPGRPGQPQHGPARNVEWRLEESGAPDGIAHLLFRLTSLELRDTAWAGLLPVGVTAYLSAAMADKLRIDLTVSTDTDAFDFEAALHTYFSVGDVRQVELRGLEGCTYADRVHGRPADPSSSSPSQLEEPLLIHEPVDRTYEHEGSITIVDPVLHRSIVVAKRNSHNTVVWNPGPEKAPEMADVDDAAWSGFVCVEAANTGRHAVHLEPGQSHTMTLIVDVRLES